MKDKEIKDKVVAIIIILLMFSFYGWLYYGKSMCCPKCHIYLYYDTHIINSNTWNGSECLNCGQKVNAKTADWVYPWNKKETLNGKIIKK